MAGLATTSNVTRPIGHGYDVRIDDNYFRLGKLDPNVPLIDTAELQPDRVDTSQSAEDIRPTFGDLFSRSDFRGGEGLAFAHRRNQISPEDRYWRSSGIDIHASSDDEAPYIQLSNAVSSIETSTDTNLHLAFDGTALYMAEGTMVRRSTDFSTFADDDPHAGATATTVEGLATLGTTLYAALGTSGVHERPADTGTWADLGVSGTVDGVWDANGQLLVSTGTTLASVTLSTGATTTLITLPTGETWVDVCDAGEAVLAVATSGIVYALTSDAGALSLAGQTPTPGETPTAVAAIFGLVLLATGEDVTGGGAVGRLWSFSLSDNFTLTGGQLLREWGHGTTVDSTDHTIQSITATRDFFYFGLESDDGTAIWRYSVKDGGIDRWLEAPSDGLVVGTINAENRLYFTVSEAGAYKRADTYEETGYVIGPLVDHYSGADKVWAGALIDARKIPAGARVELLYSTDPEAIEDSTHSSWTTIKDIVNPDSTESPITDESSRYLVGMIKLHGTGSVTAKLRSYTFRAYPGPSDLIVRFPVKVSDRYQRPGRAPGIIPGLGNLIHNYLKHREGTYAEVELLATGEIFRGVIKNIRTAGDDAGFGRIKQTEAWVTVQGRRVRAETATDEDNTLGIGTMGIMGLG